MNKINPLVSIIIPLFNCADYITDAIHSALNQTWKNIEIIVVNDGSTDASLQVVKILESDIVKVFTQPNKGASAARNLGLQKANGTYIQYLDADDLLSPEKIEMQINALEGKPNHIAICPTIYFLNGENPIELLPDKYDLEFLYTTDNTLDFLLNLYGANGNASMITIHSWLTPKSIIDKIGPWNEQLSVDDDGEYFCRVVLGADGIIYTNRVFNYYRKYKDGNNLAGRRTFEAMKSAFDALSLKENHLIQHQKVQKIKDTFALAYFKFAVDCYPRYKSLSNEILKKANLNLKIRPKLNLGSKIADILGNHISWKLVRNIQFLKNKFKSS